MNNNPYSLVVNVENTVCVVEFDVDRFGDINYETWEVFYNRNFERDSKQVFKASDWVIVNDLLHDETWNHIEKQIIEQWDDVKQQIKEYHESY